MSDKPTPKTTDATATPAIAPGPTDTIYVYDPNDPNKPPDTDAVTPLDETGEPRQPGTPYAPGEPQQPGVVPIRKPEPTQQPPKKAS